MINIYVVWVLEERRNIKVERVVWRYSNRIYFSNKEGDSYKVVRSIKGLGKERVNKKFIYKKWLE